MSTMPLVCQGTDKPVTYQAMEPTVMNTPSLPVSFNEAAALEAAREFIRKLGEFEFWDGLGVNAWHPDAGRRWLRQAMKNFVTCNGAGEGQALLLLIEFARAGWDDADITLREMIIEYHHQGKIFPPFLAAYNAEIVAAHMVRPPPGPRRADNIAADVAIASLVFTLTLPPHSLKARRTSRRKPSACSVTAQALAEAGMHRGGEEAIEKIWKRWGHRLLP